MKWTLRIEELAMFALGLYVFLAFLPFAWWWFLVLILTPDISMLGYLGGNKTGAFVYNFFHHRALALLVLVIGVYLENQIVILAGIILFSHIAMDRFFGYGLKYVTGFKHTHLEELK